MMNSKSYSKRFLTIIIGVLVMVEFFQFPVYAMSNQTENSDLQNYGKLQQMGKDSAFMLVNSDAQISDDYFPEIVFISEVETSNINQELQGNEKILGDLVREDVGNSMVYLTHRWLKQEYCEATSIDFTSNPSYISAGWCENGQVLDRVTQDYDMTVRFKRMLEIRFICNNLKFTDLKIFGYL